MAKNRMPRGWKNNRSDIPDGTPGGDAQEPETKKKKPKQRHLEGMEPPSIPKLDKLADTYVERRGERMAMLQSEIAARDLLEAAMHENGLTSYEYDGKTVEIVATQKVKVRTKKDGGEEGEGDGDE